MAQMPLPPSSQSLAKAVYRAAVQAVQPADRIRALLKVEQGKISLQDRSYDLTHSRCYVVGFGKAVMGMAAELERKLGDKIERGVLSVPVGSENALKTDSKIKVHFGAKNNLPDEIAFAAAKDIRNLVESLARDDVLIVCISGGGSALLPYPLHPVTVAEQQTLVRQLANAGATIFELNSVRKRMSLLKGGGLALLSAPTPTLSFILSDVIGDPLDFISSGPTVRDLDHEDTAKQILLKYGVKPVDSVARVLSRPHLIMPEAKYAHVQNIIVGNIDMALAQMETDLKEKGFKTVLLANNLEGHLKDLATFYIEEAKKYLESELFPVALIGGGEPVVVVTGKGKGGRNQELAVRVAAEMENIEGFKLTFMSAGTDGIDGPTDAAGAIVTDSFVSDCQRQELDLQAALEDNDTYTLLEAVNGGKNLVKIGHTGTNVMDVHCFLIEKKTTLL